MLTRKGSNLFVNSIHETRKEILLKLAFIAWYDYIIPFATNLKPTEAMVGKEDSDSTV